MADNHTKEVRSRNMSHIRSTNTKPEEKVRKYLFSKGFRYRKNVRKLPGCPDIVLPKYHTVIFVNGCFWHKHDCPRFVWPSTNEDYWIPKITRNVERDLKNHQILREQGWRVVVVWDCELKEKCFQGAMDKLVQVKLCTVIDNILLNEKPADFEAFLQKLEQQGYEIKRGKHTSVKGARQKRFIRFRTLGAGYSEDEIKAVIAGEAEHRPHQKQPPKEKPFHLLVDIQAKLSEGKSESYARWAKRYNLKEMSKTLIFLQENKIGNIEEMQERVNAATARYHELGDSIKAAEQRMAEIAVLRAHIINYAKTRPVYDAYRKAGYSKKFLEEHREQITLHRAAKATFDEAGLKKLPKVKELNTEYSTLLSQKKAAYPAYRKARDEMQELMKAQKNVEIFFAEEKTTKEKAQTR